MSDDDIMDLMETLTVKMFKELLDVQFDKFPRMTYTDAMRDYASDKPDLRIPLKLVDVADLMQEVEFKVFAGPAKILRVVSLHYVFQVQALYHVAKLMNTRNCWHLRCKRFGVHQSKRA